MPWPVTTCCWPVVSKLLPWQNRAKSPSMPTMTKGSRELPALTPASRVETQAVSPLRGPSVVNWGDPRLGLAVVIMLSVQ